MLFDLFPLPDGPVVFPSGADAVFAGLWEKYGEAMARDDVKAIVLTGEASPHSIPQQGLWISSCLCSFDLCLLFILVKTSIYIIWHSKTSLGARGKFCGGFDINTFSQIHRTGKEGQ